ncbi:MAG: hypothetical protein ACK4WK_05630 [Anaerolineae bacterium]
MILVSLAAEAAQVAADPKWWAQPGATLFGGTLVFLAAWVAFGAQAMTRAQERTHHQERLGEERKARAELVEAQREEWEARIVHERQEARRTELLRLYGDLLAVTARSKSWADHGFSDETHRNLPGDIKIELTPVLAPPEVSTCVDAFADALLSRDASAVHETVEDLRLAIREHLATFDNPPRRDVGEVDSVVVSAARNSWRFTPA